MKRLPIGISSFEKIRSEDYVYIDKTQHVFNLVNIGGCRYFLSRPRRFGKSLLIDTIKQAFEGNKKLFKGLYLENHWDWEIRYPVLHFTFGSGNVRSPDALDEKIGSFLDDYYTQYQLENVYREVSIRFEYLIKHIAKSVGQVVILVDEYDKPILDNIDRSEIACAMRERLRNFYSVIKAQDEHVKFTMLTGVSKFSKVSLFSDLNHLDDITLDGRYADICGYNQAELDASFKVYLEEGNVDHKLLKYWYNGYNFSGSECQNVYNPFDILLFINKGYHYQNYWFETATPTFLIKMIEKSCYFIPDLERIVVGEDLLRTFHVDNMPVTTLLFQTGYLTVKQMTAEGQRATYQLGYPNYEVKYSLNESLANIGTTADHKNRVLNHLTTALVKEDFQGLKNIFSSHFASIPNDWYRKNKIDQYEGFYASIVYSFFVALGYEVVAEDVTNQGKIDLTLIMSDKVLIIEFKLKKHGDAKAAIEQIKEKNYAQKYRNSNKPIYLVGISFDPKERNVVDLLAEQY
ncbi:ATP-binding protein [Caedibacter taeniospiralis]|uniref:ATP-binding protein n=1 Tax=Caedibacter taeniospiralis TaxID=28907 RepID=UPI000C273936|nr:ATP-binding protein [Caedibacter taeniospiralis]